MSWKGLGHVIAAPFKLPGAALGLGQNAVVGKVIDGLTRHCGSAVGGYLAAHGLIGSSQIEAVAGAVVTILSALASAVEKQRP